MAKQKYRTRLSSAEAGMYDLMLKTSELLKGLADEVRGDVLHLIVDVDEPTFKAQLSALEHDAVTYAFTLGVQFAVNRQQEVARQVAKKMGMIPEDS